MRSDWEQEIADYIEEEYPELKVKFNCRNIVPSRNSSRNLELDVYIPKLKLAFELNGESYHDHEQYKLDKEFGTCDSDEMYKKQYCKKHGIKLVHIWSSEDEESIEYKIDKHIKKQKKKKKAKNSSGNKTKKSKNEKTSWRGVAMSNAIRAGKNRSKGELVRIENKAHIQFFQALYGKLLMPEEQAEQIVKCAALYKQMDPNMTETEATQKAEAIVEKNVARVQRSFDTLFGLR